jgi:hypothetical protein
VPSVTVTDSGNLLLAAPGRHVQMQVRYECCVGRKSVLVLSACIHSHTHAHTHTHTHYHKHKHKHAHTHTHTHKHKHTLLCVI